MRRLWKETMKEVEEPVLSRYGNFIRGFPLLGAKVMAGMMMYRPYSARLF
jgi:hypothetical protein